VQRKPNAQERGPRAGDRPGSPRFVGREAELLRLTDALADLPALVLVEGEAGIGKSRLVREALDDLDVRGASDARGAGVAPPRGPVAPDGPGAPRVPDLTQGPGRVDAAGPRGPRALVAVCPPFREALTLGPIVEAARQGMTGAADLGLSALAGTLRPLFPEWADSLPAAPEPLADTGAARHRLMRALAELLDALGVDVLVVEDVHWADEATLDFLLFLASRGPWPLSLVLTYRPEDVPADSLLLRLSSRRSSGVGHLRLTLDGLPVDATAALVSSMLDDEHVSGAFAAFLHDRTEGVPLALEECVRLLRDRADLIRRNGEWVRRTLEEIAVPPTIRDAVAERVARLGPDAQRVLLAAAVLTGPADGRMLAAVAALPAARAAAAVDEAVRTGLLTEDAAGRAAFRHALAARAVYDRVPAADRRAAHRRAGEVLEGVRPGAVGPLAHHFLEAGETARWRGYAERAADLALASGDHLSAVTLLHRLITEPDCPASAVAPLVQKMPLHAFTAYSRRDEVVAMLRSLLDTGRLGPRQQAEVRGQLARMMIHLGDHAAAAAELERAVPDLTDRTYVVAWAMTALGVPVDPDWSVAEHLSWLDRAARTVAGSAIPPEDRRSLLVDRVTALLDLGEESGWALAAELGDDESTPQAALHLARGSLNTGNAAMKWGCYEEARRRLETAVEVAGRHGYQRLRDMAVETLVHLDWCTGRWTGLSERVAEWLDVEGEPLFHLDALLVATLLRITGADTGPADRDDLRLVREESVRRGLIDQSFESAAGLARLALDNGDPDEALAWTQEPVGRLVRKGVWLWATEVVPVRVAALIAVGRQGEAEQLAAGFRDGLRGRTVPAPAAALRVCDALLAQGRGEFAEAARAWAAAAAAWQALPRPYTVLRCRERRAQCLLAAGERAAALDELDAVRRDFATLGAARDAARVLAAVEAHGAAAPGPRRGGRRGYGDQLSPRELEVVRLMLHGLTNREIAVALSRSPKTVAAQLNSAMRKHGVSSRTALAVRVTRSGTV
jgi:DNA-binding CsgD family transcriptional regulator/tetratricopeptide (TPR) repeat protein